MDELLDAYIAVRMPRALAENAQEAANKVGVNRSAYIRGAVKARVESENEGDGNE